jgi:hypothetical protein
MVKFTQRKNYPLCRLEREDPQVTKVVFIY